MNRIVLLPLRLFAVLRTFLVRDRRGSAAIEFALGSVVLLTTASIGFDLYTRISADTAGARMAAIMADYVSRDAQPNLTEMNALRDFLYTNELGTPANLVYVVTAIRKPAGTPPEVLWTDDTIRKGDPTATQELAETCALRIDNSSTLAPVLPSDFTMGDDDVVIIVEFCARLTRQGALTGQFLAGKIYRLYALPARTQGKVPDPPDYSLATEPEEASPFANRRTLFA